MYTDNMSFPSEVIKKIVNSVEDAVGDDIRMDIHRNDLQTTNSFSTRIWDLINTNLIKSLKAEDCTIAKAHRGCWEMVIIFEKNTQCIFTFMREKRFEELRKRQCKRTHMHYIDMLTRQFNKELLADSQQLSLFSHSFSDENKLSEKVQNLLRDLEGDADIVRNHVLVLFDTVGYQLTHIRAVKITPNLDIARQCESDWSEYIASTESIVVERIDDPDIPGNNPNRGLSLKAKALARQKNKPKHKNNEHEIKHDNE